MHVRSIWIVSIAVAAATLAATAAADAGPGMSTRWKSTKSSREECIKDAQRALRETDFTKNAEVVGDTAFGERGNYTPGVRCVVDKEMVFFVVAGPNSKEAGKFNASIAEGF